MSFKETIEHKWITHQFNIIFNSFEKMVDSVYKTESRNDPNINKDELRLKMWNTLHNTAARRWNWNKILNKK